MALRRGGTPLTGAPPSLEASNQAQIEDLVQRNRTLEYKNTKLTEQVTQEAARAKEAVLEIQRQWEVNQQQWKEGCEDIITSYRIVQRQVEVELEKERTAVIKEMKITREEKLERLKRDTKIKMFQINEQALERRIEELEEEKADAVEEIEELLRQEREKLSNNAVKLRETKEALARSIREKEDKEAKYNKLVSEYSTVEASSGTIETKLQRTQLKFEGAQHKITELEHQNNELKRQNTDLNNQRERWENLETKGGEAKEMEHKKRVALQLELNDLKEKYEAQEAELAKAKRKFEKVKEAASNYQAELDEQKELEADLNKKLAKLQRHVEKLKVELEEERARVRPPTPQKSRQASPPIEEIEEIEEDEDEEPVPTMKTSAKKPVPKQSKAEPSKAKEKLDKPPQQTARKSTGGKAPPPRRTNEAPTASEEPEVVNLEEDEPEPPKKQRKGKAKATEPDDIDVEEIPAPTKRGKRKAPEGDKNVDDGEVQIVEKLKPRKKRAESELREVSVSKKSVSKPRSTARPASKQVVEVPEGEEEAGGGQKKKKRKIFPTSSNIGAFSFDSLAPFNDNGLDIPSMLSPVRPGEPVPQRSSGLSFMGNAMKSSRK